MATTIRSSLVKTRKPHRCWECKKTFPTGTQMASDVIADEGRIDNVYTCQDCQRYINENSSDWTIDTWESLAISGLGYWKDKVWYPLE